MPSARLDWTATDQSWELLSPRLLLGSNRQIQTGSSAGRRDLIPRNINCLAWRERERERMSHRLYWNISMRRTVSVHDNCHHSVPAQSGLLRLSCFPESVGLNDHCGPQIQLKVITGATSSQTNNRVRPRPSFVIFSKIRPDDSDQHRITIREAGA